MRFENPKQWRKALQDSMAVTILLIHGKGKTPNPSEEFEKWARDHRDLLKKYGLFTATRLFRIYWGRLIKKLVRPKSEDAQVLEAQLCLEGIEVFRKVDHAFYFTDTEGRRRSVNTQESTHTQRQSGAALLRRGAQFDIIRAEQLEMLDDWSLPYIQKYGDLPLIDLVAKSLKEGQA